MQEGLLSCLWIRRSPWKEWEMHIQQHPLLSASVPRLFQFKRQTNGFRLWPLHHLSNSEFPNQGLLRQHYFRKRERKRERESICRHQESVGRTVGSAAKHWLCSPIFLCQHTPTRLTFSVGRNIDYILCLSMLAAFKD